MLESINSDVFEYKKISPEEQQRRGILGRLVGVIADTKNPTRNGRKYSEKLWENVFNDPIMQERINTNCCFGELGHPADREETDMEKICICMDGMPKKDRNGKLQAIFNILDTPNGRILKTLCDYGCNIGVSSRGSGDVNTGFDGTEEVDPDTYDCQGWDAVIIPAVKEARVTYVTESLNTTRYNKTLRQKLSESLEKASADDRKVMQESLVGLGIDLEETLTEATHDNEGFFVGTEDGSLLVLAKSKEGVKQHMKSRHNIDKYSVNQTDISDWNKTKEYCAANNIIIEVADDEGIISNESLNMNSEENQSELLGLLSTIRYNIDSVSNYIINHGDEFETEKENIRDFILNSLNNIKELSSKIEDNDIINQHNSDDINEVDAASAVDNNEAMMSELQEALKARTELDTKLMELQEKLSVCYAKEATYEESIAKYKKAIRVLSDSSKKADALTEKLEAVQKELTAVQTANSNKDVKITQLEGFIKVNQETKHSLKENISSKKNEINSLNESLNTLKQENKSLTEALEEAKKDLELKKSDYSHKIENSNKLVEKYKKIANTAVDRYINSQAVRLGVKSEEIKNRLPESYSFTDIDKVCEDMKEYKVAIGRLPFNVSLNEGMKIKARPSRNDYLAQVESNVDDTIDNQLLSMVNMK